MARPKRHKSRARKSLAPLKEALVRIERIGARGDGEATVEGRRIFVPFTAPGDEARISYRGERGQVDALTVESLHRAAPPCPYFGKCGGCALQHVSEDFYAEWKRDLVVNALQRAGFDSAIVGPLMACTDDGRRRAAFTVRKTAHGVVFGFNERGSDRIVDIERCLVLAPPLQAIMAGLRTLAQSTPDAWRSFDVLVTLCVNGVDVSITGGDASDAIFGNELTRMIDAARSAGIIRVVIENAPLISFETPIVTFGDTPVALPAGSFLQASQAGEAALIKLVVENIGGAKRVADLFSGCGTFTLPMAKNASVEAYDSDAPAISALDAAVRGGALRHPVKAELRNLFDRPLLVAELKSFDAVVFDPPRAGAQAQAAQLAQSGVPRIVGVSCNPVSFARDARILADGGYVLSQVSVIDQFAYSPHVELVGVFQKG